MQYGEIAGNRSINAMIYQCFDFLEEGDQRAFVKKFREQRQDAHQVMHTYRELLAGAFVSSLGFIPEYDPEIDKQTPDWRFGNSEGGKQFILEVVNFHTDKKTDDEQRVAFAKGVMWTGWLNPNTERLYSSLRNKAAKYKDLVESTIVPT